MDCMTGVCTTEVGGVAWCGAQCRGQSRPLSNRRLDKITASLRLRILVAEVPKYCLDLQGIFRLPCSNVVCLLRLTIEIISDPCTAYGRWPASGGYQYFWRQ